MSHGISGRLAASSAASSSSACGSPSRSSSSSSQISSLRLPAITKPWSSAASITTLLLPRPQAISAYSRLKSVVNNGLMVFLSRLASCAGQQLSSSFFRSSLTLSSCHSCSLRSDRPATLVPRHLRVWMMASPSRRRRRATRAAESSRSGVSKYWLSSSRVCQPDLLRFFSRGCSRRAARVSRLARSLSSVSLCITGSKEGRGCPAVYRSRLSSVGSWWPSSRVNPLPQVLCCPQVRRFPCESGFTREEAHMIGRHCYDGQRFRGVRACRCRR